MQEKNKFPQKMIFFRCSNHHLWMAGHSNRIGPWIDGLEEKKMHREKFGEFLSRPKSEMLPHDRGLDRFSFLMITETASSSMTTLARCWTDTMLKEMREGERKNPWCLSCRSWERKRVTHSRRWGDGAYLRQWAKICLNLNFEFSQTLI